MNALIEQIGAEVRAKINTGTPPTEAAEQVAKEYVGDENGKLRKLLDAGVLTLAFRTIEYETLYRPNLGTSGNPTARGGPNDGVPTSLQTSSDKGSKAPTRYAAFYANPLDLVAPIPGTGARKRLGDWTAKDAMAKHNYHRQTSKTHKATADLWKRIALKIGDGRLEDVWLLVDSDDQSKIGGPS